MGPPIYGTPVWVCRHKLVGRPAPSSNPSRGPQQDEGPLEALRSWQQLAPRCTININMYTLYIYICVLYIYIYTLYIYTQDI